MKWRAVPVAVVLVAAPMAVVACTQIVAGSAERAAKTEDRGSRGYGFAGDRCGLLLDTTVKEIVGADKLVRPYSGAVCQYVTSRESTVIDVTYSWLTAGTLQRERGIAEHNRDQITDMVVQQHQAFLARRSVTGNACSATASTDPGVASWWVQVRGNAAVDPCADAQNLLGRTLSSGM